MSSERYLFPVCLALLALCVLPRGTTSEEEGGRRLPKGEFYTNSWAVEVAGGPAAADSVARRHGFLNLGQVTKRERDTNF